MCILFSGIEWSTEVLRSKISPIFQDLVSSFHCSCALGYTGRSCETEVNECDSGPCLHGGTCHNLEGRYVCTCVMGYAGMCCEVKGGVISF